MKPVELDLDAIPKAPRKKSDKKPSYPRRTAAWRRIIRSLRLDGPQTTKALAKNLVLRETDVRRLIAWYVKYGAVVREGRRYKITEKGASFAKPLPRRTRQAPKPKPNAWTKIVGDDD